MKQTPRLARLWPLLALCLLSVAAGAIEVSGPAAPSGAPLLVSPSVGAPALGTGLDVPAGGVSVSPDLAVPTLPAAAVPVEGALISGPAASIAQPEVSASVAPVAGVQAAAASEAAAASAAPQAAAPASPEAQASVPVAPAFAAAPGAAGRVSAEQTAANLAARVGPDGAGSQAQSSLATAFDGQDSAGQPGGETVHHWNVNGQTLGAAPRDHDAWRPSPPPAPVPAALADLVPSARDANPGAWTGRISLHLHSVYSDGTMTPSDLIAEAARQGITVMALTDHDTTAGVAEAVAKGRALGVTVLVGEEMTARGGVHIGALNLDPNNQELQQHNEHIRQIRLARAKSIIAHLNARFAASSDPKEQGLVLTIDEVIAQSKFNEGGTIEIPHIARVLLAHGLINSVDDAYNTYLTPDILTDPSVEPDPTVAQVMQVIKAAGGKAFLNHPYTIRAKTDAQQDALAQQYLALGMDGVEAYRPSNATSPDGKARFDSRVAKYLGWAFSRGLIVGNGADFHGLDTHLNHMVVYMPNSLALKLVDALGVPRSAIDVPAPESAPAPAAAPAKPTALASLLAAPVLMPDASLAHFPWVAFIPPAFLLGLAVLATSDWFKAFEKKYRGLSDLLVLTLGGGFAASVFYLLFWKINLG